MSLLSSNEVSTILEVLDVLSDIVRYIVVFLDVVCDLDIIIKVILDWINLQLGKCNTLAWRVEVWRFLVIGNSVIWLSWSLFAVHLLSLVAFGLQVLNSHQNLGKLWVLAELLSILFLGLWLVEFDFLVDCLKSFLLLGDSIVKLHKTSLFILDVLDPVVTNLLELCVQLVDGGI